MIDRIDMIYAKNDTKLSGPIKPCVVCDKN